MSTSLMGPDIQVGARVLVIWGALAGLRGTVVGVTKHGSMALEADGLCNGVWIVVPPHLLELLCSGERGGQVDSPLVTFTCSQPA